MCAAKIKLVFGICTLVALKNQSKRTKKREQLGNGNDNSNKQPLQMSLNGAGKKIEKKPQIVVDR